MAHKVVFELKYWQPIFWNTIVIYSMWTVHPFFVLLRFVVAELKINDFVVILLAGEHGYVLGRNRKVLPQKIKPIPAVFNAGWQFYNRFSTVKLVSYV